MEGTAGIFLKLRDSQEGQIKTLTYKEVMSGGTEQKLFLENPEAEIHGVEIKLLLPTGQVKDDAQLIVENTVREEKERFLRESQIPYPALYVMVLHGPQGTVLVMEDSKVVDEYTASISQGVETLVEIKKKSSQIERPAKPIRPELFNVHLK